MKLSRSSKIVAGLATGAYVLLPLVFIPAWIFFVMLIASSSEYGGEPPPFLIFSTFSVIFPLICLINILHLGLITFYLVHIIRNNAGSDTGRILSGVGLFIMPWLAMPVYYFLYVWPETPPVWASPLAPMLPGTGSGRAAGSPAAPVVEAEVVDQQADVQTVSPAETGGESEPAFQEQPAVEGQPEDGGLPEAEEFPADATMIRPAAWARPQEEEAEPAKKPRRKRVSKAPAEAAPSETEPPSDATMIGLSPLAGGPVDET
jgi:hypothetical protein